MKKVLFLGLNKTKTIALAKLGKIHQKNNSQNENEKDSMAIDMNFNYNITTTIIQLQKG
jgi:hypothetical protein